MVVFTLTSCDPVLSGTVALHQTNAHLMRVFTFTQNIFIFLFIFIPAMNLQSPERVKGDILHKAAKMNTSHHPSRIL